MTNVPYVRVNRQYVAMTETEVWSFIDSQKVMFAAFVDENEYPLSLIHI